MTDANNLNEKNLEAMEEQLKKEGKNNKLCLYNQSNSFRLRQRIVFQ